MTTVKSLTANRLMLVVAASGLLMLAQPASAADSQSNTTDYTITLSGFSLAKASFQTTLQGRSFEIQGHFTTTGLARLFKRVDGTAEVNGKMKGSNFVPESYRTDYVAGSAHKTYEVSFAGGGVKSYDAKPGMSSLPANWVGLTAADLARAVDPLSGLILPGDASPCQGTIPIFDGEARTDVELTDKGQAMYRAGNVRLAARICGMRLSPKAGYSKGHGDMDYIGKIRGMEIWFAKSPIANVYAPVKIKAPTGFGSVIISATRFGA